MLSFFIKHTETSTQNINCFVKSVCDFKSHPKFRQVNACLYTDFSGIQTLALRVKGANYTTDFQGTKYLPGRTPSLLHASVKT